MLFGTQQLAKVRVSHIQAGNVKVFLITRVGSASSSAAAAMLGSLISKWLNLSRRL